MNEEKVERFSCIGHSVPKIDALDKVLGRAVYAEDILFPNMLYGRVLRAGIPHALIEQIDTSKARAMKGVVCVLTAYYTISLYKSFIMKRIKGSEIIRNSLNRGRPNEVIIR